MAEIRELVLTFLERISHDALPKNSKRETLDAPQTRSKLSIYRAKFYAEFVVLHQKPGACSQKSSWIFVSWNDFVIHERKKDFQTLGKKNWKSELRLNEFLGRSGTSLRTIKQQMNKLFKGKTS